MILGRQYVPRDCVDCRKGQSNGRVKRKLRKKETKRCEIEEKTASSKGDRTLDRAARAIEKKKEK